MRKINLNIWLLVCVLMMTLAVPTAGWTIYVDPNGSADFTTIQAAIDAANNNDDEIEVAPGIYNESINFLGKAITLRSTDPNDPNVIAATVIAAPIVVVCTSGEGPDTVLSGFTITNGSFTWGGGMHNSNSSPTVTNCIFSDNQAIDNGPFPGGAGMYNSNSSPMVTNCIFSENHALGTANGGGMYNKNNSHPTVTDCKFINNSARSGGGMHNDNGSHPILTGCTFRGNTATFGGGMSNVETSPTVKDCTFIDNTAQNYGGGMRNYTGSPEVTGCTFSGNTAGLQGGGMCNESSASPTVSNCSFTDNLSRYLGGGMHNEDYSSPTVTNCVFWGNIVKIDSDGFGGVGGGMYNENYSTPSVINCTFTSNVAQKYGGGMYNYWYANAIVTNCIFWGDIGGEISSTDSSPVVTYCNVQGDYEGAGNINAYPKFIDAEGGDFHLDDISLCADAGNNASVPAGILIDLDGNTRFVDELRAPSSGAGTPPIVDMGAYERQQDPGPIIIEVPWDLISIQMAIVWCLDGDEIEVAPGTYSEAINFNGKAVRLYSSGGPAVTTIDASGLNSSVVACNSGEGPDTVLSGFTIRGGTGILDSFGQICGGGIRNEFSDPTVINCIFINNSADFGGGLFNYDSNPRVINCLFISNTAQIWGGGMYSNASNPTMTNCTFTANIAGARGGGIYSNGSNLIARNCILWGDIAPNGKEIALYASPSIDISYCDVMGGQADIYEDGTNTIFWNNNIDTDPFFIDPNGLDDQLGTQDDNVRLRSISPCIDAGDNTVVTWGTDLDNKPRLRDGDENGTITVDMGAYELCGAHNKTQGRVYATIQGAIDGANNGDKIEVEPGIYKEAINFMGKSIRLYSSDGPEVTIIDATGLNSSVVTCASGEDPNTVLEGFTLTGGCGEFGGGMHIFGSSPCVTHCIITGNSAAYGGGMRNTDSNPMVTNCVFSTNKADSEGGGMYNYSSSPTVTNCTFSGNHALGTANGGGMYNNNSSNPKVTNCILWGDEPNEIVDSSGSTSVVTYSDVKAGWSGEGNIDQNPLLRNVEQGDLSLAPWSPCIDAGNNDVVGPNTIDIPGQPRLVDGDCNGTITVDMGALEFQHAYGGDFDSSCLVNMADYAVLAWVWLASPQSGNWDPVCDISTPADGHIDAGDVKVLTGNWLGSIDTPITCDANRLKDEFGMDAASAAAVLSQVCGITDVYSVEQILYSAGYMPEEYLEFTAIESVRKFAPILYFDQAHIGLPMSAQVYFQTMMSPSPDPITRTITWTTPWNGPCGKPGVIHVDGRDEDDTCGMQNNQFWTLVDGQVPTYYKVISDIDSEIYTGPRKGRLRIAYWWFYGFQKYCNPLVLTDPGEHHGDWEFIWVTTDPDRSRADTVTYVFHGVWYTRKWPGGFTRSGDRPIVYVGKVGHGNYHNHDHSGWMYGTPHYCCHYADYKDPSANSKWYNAYDNLVSLRGSEPWMLADRVGSLYEYYGKKYKIYKWRWGPHISYFDDGFNWTHIYACGTHPTVSYPMDWDIASCKAEGCRDHDCDGLVYTSPLPDYDQGWQWGGSASSATESATPTKPAPPVSYGSVASCGRCGASRFGALVRLGEYWLATP